MTDFDMFIVSLIINIGLIIQNRMQGSLMRQSLQAMVKCSVAIEQAADGKAEFYREGKKILLREVRNETTKPSTPTV